MRIIGVKFFHGRNIYNHKPVAKITVDLGSFSNTPTSEIKGFNERLIKNFPNLRKHTCCFGHEGGFLERLESGTYLAHVLEHLLIDLQNTFDYDVKYGKTIEEKGSKNIFNILLEYESPEFIKFCCIEGASILNGFIYDEYVDFEDIFNKLSEVKYETDLGLSTNALITEAKKRGIPVTRVGNQNLVRLNYGNKARLIQATLLDCTSCVAVDIACDKNLTKSILNDMQIPVPYGFVVSSASEAYERALDIDASVVIKPLNSNQGKGVRANLYSRDEIFTSYDIARNYSKKVIVEKFIEGKDYRVLVVGDKVVAVALRVPANVVGDGEHTIKELINEINKNPNRGRGHEKPLTKIEINQKTYEVLNKQNLTLRDIPKKGEKVILCENCNISTGGTSEDCTDIIHPHNAEYAVRSAKALKIDVAGIDFVTNDISQSIKETNGAIIEVNAAPGIRMHLYPYKGQPRNVAKDIIDYLFSDDKCVNFPIVSVTGTNGKTTTVRLISHVLQILGKIVGRTSTTGTYINEICLSDGDNAGPESARKLLTHNIDCAVFETARGGIIKKGLGYDLADVGIITNIAYDHIGQNNIHNLEELAQVKSLVVEAIKPNGYAVLNAEDESSKHIKENIYEDIIYFYMDKENIKTNIENYICVFFENNKIIIKDKAKNIEVADITDIPITLNGAIKCNIYNCLAAVSALYALKVPLENINQGLKTFKNNIGRYEIYEYNDYKIMLDFAHNYHGINELFKTCKTLKFNRLVGVVGMPNNRLEEDYKRVSTLFAEHLDFIYIKEDKDLVRRKSGEVINIFLNAIISSGFPKEKIVIINSEVEALKTAIKNHEKDDLIVVMYEELQPLKNVIKNIDIT